MIQGSCPISILYHPNADGTSSRAGGQRWGSLQQALRFDATQRHFLLRKLFAAVPSHFSLANNLEATVRDVVYIVLCLTTR
jgi:hypothetical protein